MRHVCLGSGELELGEIVAERQFEGSLQHPDHSVPGILDGHVHTGSEVDREIGGQCLHSSRIGYLRRHLHLGGGFCDYHTNPSRHDYGIVRNRNVSGCTMGRPITFSSQP